MFYTDTYMNAYDTMFVSMFLLYGTTNIKFIWS